MSGQIKRIRTLAEDMSLLGALGEVVTLQIDLIGTEKYSDQMKEAFNDSEGIGLYVDNMVLQRVTETPTIDYFETLNKIVEITGDYETIDSVTALIRIQYQGRPVEITVQLLGNHKAPQLMQVTDQDHYFDLVRLIQTRWQFAVSMR